MKYLKKIELLKIKKFKKKIKHYRKFSSLKMLFNINYLVNNLEINFKKFTNDFQNGIKQTYNNEENNIMGAKNKFKNII